MITSSLTSKNAWTGAAEATHGTVLPYFLAIRRQAVGPDFPIGSARSAAMMPP